MDFLQVADFFNIKNKVTLWYLIRQGVLLSVPQPQNNRGCFIHQKIEKKEF